MSVLGHRDARARAVVCELDRDAMRTQSQAIYTALAVFFGPPKRVER